MKRQLAGLAPAASRNRCAQLLLGGIKDELAGMRLGELLVSCHGIGELNVDSYAAVAGASITKRLGDLTDRQRTLIAGALLLTRAPRSPGKWG